MELTDEQEKIIDQAVYFVWEQIAQKQDDMLAIALKHFAETCISIGVEIAKTERL